MTDVTNSLRDRVASALGGGRPFALYRLPGGDALSWIEAEPHEVEVTMELRELDGSSGFVFAPFSPSESSPILLFSSLVPESISLKEGWDAPYATASEPPEAEEISPDYEAGFSRFVTALGAGRLEKLVLSRAEEVAIPEGFSMVEAFLVACASYPKSFTYLVFTPLSGIWMGSTPELLLGGASNSWHTMALAGTQAVEAGANAYEWSGKNLHEHECVVRHIREVLSSDGAEVQEHAVETVQAGRVAHLRTRFDFALSEGDALGSWLGRMHPTPAVSGLPQVLAYDFIRQYEGYDRRYYTGCVGYLNPEGRTDVFVNLRCMQITSSALVLYAGGGIVRDSLLEDEWTETERKMSTMKQVLQGSASSEGRVSRE